MKALFIGGTGTISMAISKLLLKKGWDLYLLNRGNRNKSVELKAVYASSSFLAETVAYVLNHKECQNDDPEFDAWCDKVIDQLNKAKEALKA